MKTLKAMAAAVALAGAALASPAHAWEWVEWNGGQVWAQPWEDDTSLSFQRFSNQWYTIFFNGYASSYQGGNTPIPGLASTVTIRLDRTENDGKTWVFDYLVTNDSQSPVTSSRVSTFGMDVDPNIQNAQVNGIYNSVAYNSGVPMFNEIITDVCFYFKNGGGQNNCHSGSSGGVVMGQDAGGGEFTLNFANAINTVNISDPWVRYQSLSYGGSTISSKKGGFVQGQDSGMGMPVAWVPEPGTWALMIGGFGLAGASLRRRRALAAI